MMPLQQLVIAKPVLVNNIDVISYKDGDEVEITLLDSCREVDASDGKKKRETAAEAGCLLGGATRDNAPLGVEGISPL